MLTRYDIVEAYSTQDLARKVNGFLLLGWKLHGSMVCFTVDGDVVVFTQPITREG